MENLSTAQRELLEEKYRWYDSSRNISVTKPTATEKALIRRGLLSVGDCMGTPTLKVTPAGRCVVQLLREIEKLRQERDR